jgi:hypothetical protein
MEKMSFAISLERGKHLDLQSFAGKWKGVSKVWFEPDVLADESPIEGTIESILEGRFLLHRYTTRFKDRTIEGIYLIGFDLQSNQFQVAWADSFHMSTAIMFSKGNANDHDFEVLGSFSDHQQPPQFWGWRTDIHFESEELVIIAHMISPAGQSQLATEIRYSRIT